MKDARLILEHVLNERLAQENKWGEQNHTDEIWLAILTEEIGEVAKAILEGTSITDELVQVAAVAVAWHECIWHRRKEGGSHA